MDDGDTNGTPTRDEHKKGGAVKVIHLVEGDGDDDDDEHQQMMNDAYTTFLLFPCDCFIGPSSNNPKKGNNSLLTYIQVSTSVCS